MTRRVAITGVGLTSPIGDDLGTVSRRLRGLEHGIVTMPEWERIGGLRTRLAGRCQDPPRGSFPRKKIRGMGRVGLLAAHASTQAVADAGLSDEVLASGRLGLAYGSSHGSSAELERFCEPLFATHSLAGARGSSYLAWMSNTCAVNLATFFGITGRVMSTCSACTSGSLAVGHGYELIRSGAQDVVLAGGADELHYLVAGVFDILFATSTRYNDQPDQSPRPFDEARDGLVVGEGAGTVVLEELGRAKARGAHVYAEVIGFGTNCDGSHLTEPSEAGMAGAMRLAVADADARLDGIDYVNAHGTATARGDVAESHATRTVVGGDVPISSTKSYTGHTMGACGAHEVIFCLAMMRDGFLPPTRNLARVDPRCAELDYILDAPRTLRPRTVMTNNFAFGGVNTSLILRAADWPRGGV